MLTGALGMVGCAPLAATSPPIPGDKPAALHALARYLCESEDRQSGGGSVQFEIEAALPRLKKHGVMSGVRVVSAPGRVAYRRLHFAGDEMIKTAVIARFLSAETKEKAESEDAAIADRNYRFFYRGHASYGGRTAFVFRLEPKRRRVGLVRGELWIDGETAEPLREWGELVKPPSALLSHVNLVRDYELTGGHTRPLRIIVSLRAAFVGPAELTMWLYPEGTGLPAEL